MDRQILIIDDEIAILKMLEKAFLMQNYSPSAAQSAEEALMILREKDIKVMFVDMQLPGMNGIEFCRQIRNDNPIACIYAMTGYSSVFELLDCREAGFDDYFLKPLDLQIILKTAKDSFEKIERWKKK